MKGLKILNAVASKLEESSRSKGMKMKVKEDKPKEANDPAEKIHSALCSKCKAPIEE